MKHKIHIELNVIIAAYNADARENKLIGLFSTATIAGAYFYDCIGKKLSARRIFNAVKYNTRLHEHKYGYGIALRYAKPEYVALLSDNPFLIMEGYEQPPVGFLKGFTNDSKNMGQFVER